MKRLLANVAVVALCLTILTLLLMSQPTTSSAAPPRPVIPPLPVMPAGNINAAAGNNGNQGGNNGNQGGNNGNQGGNAGNNGANGNAGNNGANGAGGGAPPPPAFHPAAGSFFVVYPQPVQSGQATSLGSYPVGLVPVQMATGMQGNNQNNNNLGVLIALGLINNAILNQQLLLGGVGGKLGIGGGLNGMYGGY